MQLRAIDHRSQSKRHRYLSLPTSLGNREAFRNQKIRILPLRDARAVTSDTKTGMKMPKARGRVERFDLIVRFVLCSALASSNEQLTAGRESETSSAWRGEIALR